MHCPGSPELATVNCQVGAGIAITAIGIMRAPELWLSDAVASPTRLPGGPTPSLAYSPVHAPHTLVLLYYGVRASPMTMHSSAQHSTAPHGTSTSSPHLPSELRSLQVAITPHSTGLNSLCLRPRPAHAAVALQAGSPARKTHTAPAAAHGLLRPSSCSCCHFAATPHSCLTQHRVQAPPCRSPAQLAAAF